MDCQRRIRFNVRVNFFRVMTVVFLGLAGAGHAGEWRAIPRHETRNGEAGGYDLGACEVTVAQFVAYLNRAGRTDFPETAQIRRRGQRYAARRGMKRQAVAEVTLADAEAYCRWRAAETGRAIRLPTEREWEDAARGGVDGAPYPWGWGDGGDLASLAQFRAGQPAARGGTFIANGFGLFDMAGNVAEWCAPSADLPAGQRVARGGSWAENEPAALTVTNRAFFREDYRDCDAGFRLLREWKETP